MKVTKSVTSEVHPQYRIDLSGMRVIIIVGNERKNCEISKQLYNALQNDIKIKETLSTFTGVTEVTVEDYDERKAKPEEAKGGTEETGGTDGI